MKIKKTLYILLGLISLVLGFIAAIVPMIPAFPFLLLSTFTFSRSSDKLMNWFKSTRLYKNNLDSFVKGEGMTIQTKVKIMILVTLSIIYGLYRTQHLFWIQILLSCIWIFHIYLFTKRIKTKVA